MVQAPPSPSSSATSSSSQNTPSKTVQVKSLNPPKVKGPLSFQEVGLALDASVNALAALGYDFCLFGSAGCSMYGMDHRCPHDIDIVVLSSSETCEQIKARIVRTDGRFTLIPARDPRNKWNVMWFCLPGRRKCKVDILTPGTISIPIIPPHRIVHIHRVPLTPFLCLLLLKLQGYFDHVASDEKRMQKKIPEDVDDITQMARLGAELYHAHVMQLEEEWYDSEFKITAFRRVYQFSRLFPATTLHWAAMGFSTGGGEEHQVLFPCKIYVAPMTNTPRVRVQIQA
ncbi:hypothetical protein BDZ89DRAFT_1064819 [Hymenopellis radicata]|nr:hypothetical protein BDZ89DRAFT_1064819 [Hymenopellis radicata]